MIQLKVTWTNAGSTLISNGNADDLIIVAQGTAAAPEDKGRRTNDARFFSLADDGQVKVTFDLKVDIGAATPVIRTVLKVVQRFDCKAGIISSHSYDTNIGPVAGITGLHPLVNMPAAQQASGTAVLVITTDFVDITIPWFESILKPGSVGRGVFNKGPHFDTDLHVLACLGGTPKLWFASVPAACVKADAVSALVFFRPAGYSYQTPGDDHGSVFNPDHNDLGGTNFFKIWRFLMAPVCNRSSSPPLAAKGTITADGFHGFRFLDHMDANANPPAAIERSLQQANKPVVVLFPVPDGSDYGTSMSAQLAEMARVAVGCLHSMGIVMRDDTNKKRFGTLKRFGIAGFSFGGTAMWKALASAVAAAKNKSTAGRPNQIKEIYVFDANGWRAKQSDPSDILTSASQTGDLKLRVVAATSKAANLAAFPAGKLTSSSHPDFKTNPDVYDLKKATAAPAGTAKINGWYFHYTKTAFDITGPKWFVKIPNVGIPDEGTPDRGARHQFSVFGGEDPTVGETFFCRFLKDSGF